MATLRAPVEIVRPDSLVFQDIVSNQITSATTPSVGDLLCYVLADGGTDEGVYVRFSIPQNYVGTPLFVMKGILDGAPGASDVLGTAFRKRAVADNEAADGTFDAEQLSPATVIGSSGGNYSNEDLMVQTIALTAGDYAAGDEVFGWFYLDSNVTTYAGNLLLMSVEFQYDDV